MPSRKQYERLSSGDINVYLNQLQNERSDASSLGSNLPPPPTGKRKPPPPPPPPRPKKTGEVDHDNDKKNNKNDVSNAIEAAVGYASNGRQTLMGANIQDICAVASSDAEEDYLERINRRGGRGASATTASQSKSEDGSISINDVFFRDHQDGHGSSITHTSTSGSITEGLTVMEKLKIAAKLDTSSDNRFLKELLETSIQDLEKEKERRKSFKSNKSRSLPGHQHLRRHSARPLSSSMYSDQSMASSSHRRHSFRPVTDGSAASTSSVNSATVAVPKEVRKVFSRIRGAKPLPREEIVSSVVRKLFARSKLEMGGENISFCVALGPGNGKSSEGIGKTTLAGLICSRGDVRTHYHRGIVWIDMKLKVFGAKQHPLDFERYAAALSSVLDQCGIPPHHLKLSPFVRTPCEDETLADIRMKGHMKEARSAAGKLLSSSKYFPMKQKTVVNESRRNILIVLDDLIHASDIQWFTFRYRGEKEIINDVLLTSPIERAGSVTIPVPPLNEQDGVRLMLKEANLKSNHPISKSSALIRIVNRCSFHPLTIKFVGRWLSLKHITGTKGLDEILNEINSSFEDIDATSSPVEVLFQILNKAIAPLVKGQESNTIRLCFAAFMTVFCPDSCLNPIPLEIANELFLGVADSKSDSLSSICPLFMSHGRHATKLVVEVLGALGVIVITKHSTKEKTIQIDHELIRQFGSFVLTDKNMQQLVDDFSIRCWNEVYARSHIDQYNWEDLQPDRSQKYALEKLPQHIIQADMTDVAEELLLDKTFIRGRFWTLGWIEGTKTHAEDVEQFWNKFHMSSQEDCEMISLKIFEVMENVLMGEIHRETSGPSGNHSIMEAGQCLHIISVSLGKIGLWKNAARFSDECVELISGSLETSEFIDTLLYNSASMHLEINNFETAKANAERGLSWRKNTSGEENVFYSRGLCLLGDIMFKKSDYRDAELYLKESIDILKRNPDQCHLELGIALFKLGKTQYERDLVDDALRCYDQSLEFAESELPPNHEHFVVIYNLMGDALLKKGRNTDATYAYKQALTLSSEIEPKSHHLNIRISLIEGAIHSLNGECGKAIEKYRHGMNLLRHHAPSNKGRIARILFLIGNQFMESSDVSAANAMFQESIKLMKQSIGPIHLDVAEVLVNLSSLEASAGKPERAATYLEEAINIRHAKLGDCIKVAVNLTNLGAHRKAAGDNEKSQVAYSDSVRILRGIAGQELALVNALLGLADLMNATGEYGGALCNYNECLRIQKHLFCEVHEDVASTLYSIGTVKLNQCDYEKSIALLSKSVDIMTKLYDEIHPFNGDAYNLMGFIEMKNGNENGALIRLSDALRVRRALGNRVKEAETLKNIGNVHRERNNLLLAMEQYEECLAILTEEQGKDSESVVDVLIAMGSIMSDMNFNEDAISHYKNALQKLLRLHPAKHETVASILQKMGMIQFRAGNLDSGLLYLEKTVETYRDLGGNNKWKTIPVLFVIGNIHNILKQGKEAKRAWNDAYEVFGSTTVDLYPEVKGSLKELLRSY